MVVVNLVAILEGKAEEGAEEALAMEVTLKHANCFHITNKSFYRWRIQRRVWR